MFSSYRAALAAALFITVGVAGCQSTPYLTRSAPERAAAFIELPTYDGGFPNVHVQWLSGEWIASLDKRIGIAPGPHELVVTCEYTGAFATRHYFNREQLRFTAEADRRYAIEVSKADKDKRRCESRLVDKSRKAVVSETSSQYQSPLDDSARGE